MILYPVYISVIMFQLVENNRWSEMRIPLWYNYRVVNVENIW